MGYDADGSSLSAPSAAYPPRMNELLADGLVSKEEFDVKRQAIIDNL